MAAIENRSELMALPQIPHMAIARNPRGGCSCCDLLSMMPGIITTIASLVGVVALNILQHHYFSIILVAGTIGGLYTIYQSHRFRLLKSFQDNNADLEVGIASFEKEVEVLKDRVTKTETLVSESGTQNRQLQGSIDLLSAENKRHKESTEKLGREKEELERVIVDLEKNMSMHVDQLGSLSSSLQGVEEAVFADHCVFGEKVAIFRQNVAAFREVSGKIDSSICVFNTQIEDVHECAQLVEKIFLEFEKWKSPKAIERELNMLQMLNRNEQELRGLVGYYKGQVIAMKEEVEAWRGLEAGFKNTLESLRLEVERLKYEAEQKKIIVEGVSLLVHEIKELPPGCVLPKKIIELIQLLSG